MNDKEEELNELLNDLNNYLNYKSKLRWGGEWFCYFIYKNNNYYVVYKHTNGKELLSLIDICNYLIDLKEPKIADTLYDRIDTINKKYENN